MSPVGGNGLQEMFVPLVHPPGHAQADFGEAIGLIGGVERKVHFFAFDLPHSDACFVVAYPAETTEAFCDGHVKAFAFFGGVPQSILYDNTKIVVVRILGDGKRQRTRVFAELQSHYLFQDRFGRPAKGNDKGKVEGLVGFARRNFMVPVPRVRKLRGAQRTSGRLLPQADERAAARVTLRRSVSVWSAIWPRCASLYRHPTTPARRSGRACPRYRWCATGATTTPCQRASGIAR